MKCFWRTPSGDEDWISEMTILEYESNEPVMKRPATVMKRPAKAKLDPKIRKREHSRIYHQTVDKAIARGEAEEVAKAKGRDAAKKHIDRLISQL